MKKKYEQGIEHLPDKLNGQFQGIKALCIKICLTHRLCPVCVDKKRKKKNSEKERSGMDGGDMTAKEI